ncbi:MAG: hypothetical protein KME50_10865 [Nostoc desertorum CM1-VF14]|nr:hypothetical protein [Nostoc desertorum CM1-VF14]
MLNPSVVLHSRLVRPNILTLDCASTASIIAKALSLTMSLLMPLPRMGEDLIQVGMVRTPT